MEHLVSENKPLSSASPLGGTGKGEHPLSLYHITGSREVNTKPSMCIPDMCLTVRDLYQRFRLGTLPVDLVRNVLYDECDDFDSVLANHAEGYDLVEVDAELQKLRQKFELMHRASNRVSASPSSPAPGEAPGVGSKLSETPDKELSE